MFDEHGELVLFQSLQAHQGDTGGKDPGGFTLEATDVFTEGVTFPCLKLVHRGTLRKDVFDMVARNNRFATFAGDLAAMIGGVQHAVGMLETLLAKWGAGTVSQQPRPIVNTLPATPRIETISPPIIAARPMTMPSGIGDV